MADSHKACTGGRPRRSRRRAEDAGYPRVHPTPQTRIKKPCSSRRVLRRLHRSPIVSLTAPESEGRSPFEARARMSRRTGPRSSQPGDAVNAVLPDVLREPYRRVCVAR